MLKKSLHNHLFSISSYKKGGYDIPLHTRLGTEFLVLLIALMTYLLLLAATGSISLGQLSNKWVSGLENTMTIEIPPSEKSVQQSEIVLDKIKAIKGVKSARILSKSDMSDMLSPWLGDDKTVLNDLPLPVLLSIELEKRTPEITRTIKNTVNLSAPSAIVDSHESWLIDLLKLTNGLRMTALIVFGLILCVTAMVIAGAVRSRMAMHQRELELLHIMGANDKYISLQFIRYIFFQTLKGLLFGFFFAIITLICFALYTNQTSGTLPEINLINMDWIVFLSIPTLLLIIGTLTARQTVYSVLNEMP